MSTAMSSNDVAFADQMEAHRLRQHMKDQIHNQVLMEGAKWGTVAGVAATSASLLANRYSSMYRGLTLPFKVFLVSSAIMGGFFTATDVAAMKADREFGLKFSVTKEDEINSAAMIQKKQDSMTSYLFKNRFKLLGYAYAGTLAVTLGYNFARKDIFMSQKFINARMTAQTAAIVGVGMIAALAASNHKPEVTVDPYYERVVSK